MRKSPVEHTVSGHTRKGKQVQPYTRGKGRKPQRTSKVVGRPDEDTDIGAHAFTVDFKYSEKPGDGESVIVLADTYEKALGEAYEEKVDPRNPIEVELTDPALDAVLKFIGESARKGGKLALKGIKKAGKLGAKYAIKGGHLAAQVGIAAGKGAYRGIKAGLKETSRLALYEIDRAKVQRMIKQAMSEDRVESRAARVALKLHYPDVYDICHFSRR